MGNKQNVKPDEFLHAKHSVHSDYLGCNGGTACAGYGESKTKQVSCFERGEEIVKKQRGETTNTIKI